MTPRMLRNAGLTSITALSLALVACGGSSTSTPPVPPVVNLAPMNASIVGSDSMATGHVKDFALNATDPEGKAITYTVVASAGTVAVTGNVAKLTAPAAAGTVVLTMTAKDPEGATATATKVVTVNANKAPVYDNNLPNNGTAQVTAIATSTVTINLNATDDDGDMVTVAAGTLPAWAAFNATTKVLTLTPAVADVNVLPYNLLFTATDGFGGTTTLTVAVTVNRGVNNPPSTPMAVAMTPFNNHVGRELKWTLGAIDPDGDAVTFFQPLLSDPEVTFSGSTLIWKPTAATSGKTIYVSALDARGMQSVTPLSLTLPSVTANSIPSWSGENPTVDGTGSANPTLGSFLNGGTDWLDGDDNSVYNAQMSTPWGNWNVNNTDQIKSGVLQVPTGSKLTWNAVKEGSTKFVTDADALDTLTYGYVAKTGTVPGGFSMTAGVVSYTSTDAEAETTFGVQFTANDGLATRKSKEYKFSGRINQAPKITTKLTNDKWLNPYIAPATAQDVSGTAAGLDPDLTTDKALFEVVSCTNAGVSLGNLRFSETPANVPSSGLTWAVPADFDGSYDVLVPFTDVKVDYRLRDNWNGVSATETVNFKVAGQAKFTRKIYHTYPGVVPGAPQFETAATLTAYPFKDAAVVLSGFHKNIADAAFPTSITTDALVTAYTIKELKAPSFLLDFPSTDVLSGLGYFPKNFLVMNNGGTGATVANLDETVWGRQASARELSGAAVTLTGFTAPAGTVNFYNTVDAFATMLPATLAGTPNSTIPGTISLVDHVAGSWTGTDLVTGTTTPQAYVMAAKQAKGTGSTTPFNTVGMVADFAAGATKTFTLVWTRSAFDAQHAKLNVADKQQTVYVAQSWKATAQGLPVYPTIAAEKAAQAAGIAPVGATFFSYTTSTPFSDTANTGVDLIMNGLTYKMDAIDADHNAYNVAFQGGTKTYGTVVLPASMGVRSNVDLHARALTPVIAPVTALTLNLGGATKTKTIVGVTGGNATTTLTEAITAANLSWTAPSVGTAAEYVVEVYNVSGANEVAVAKFVTTGTKLELPMGILTVGQNYAIRVRAKSAVGAALNQGWADVLSGQITW